jgi:putative transcriptional regulator
MAWGDGACRIVSKGVANRLRELRQEHGLTQEQLAAELDVTRHTILALEVGRYVPSIELALRLAAYFDQPLEMIFWLDSEEDQRLRGQAPNPTPSVQDTQKHEARDEDDGGETHG